MKGRISKKLKAIVRGLAKARQSGVALVITMLIMLVLVLISLSLVMQSNTESQLSQNETDSLHALSDAEGSIDYANRIVRMYLLKYRPTDNLTQLLLGQLNNGTVTNDVGTLVGSTCTGSCPRPYLVGFKSTLDTSINEDGLTDANEETTSGVIHTSDIPNMQGFDSNDEWEVFRFGVDEDGDGNYDGNVRTIVYARLYDNYDPTPDTTDDDMRMRLEVRTVYPVYIDPDNSGHESTSGVLAKRGQSERHLTARFGPTGSTAIRTDGNLNIQGGAINLCGECGSAHANGNMQYNGQIACGDITGTTGFNYGGGAINGDSGTIPAVYIPIINPYNDIFVPKPSDFIHLGDPSLPSWLQCAGPSQFDPGNSKYFALVKVTNNTYQVYKAYPNYGDSTNTGNKWVWRLIADNTSGLDSVLLDNCGRVVSCTATNCSADQVSMDNGSTWAAVTQGVSQSNNKFYGWDPDNNLNTSSCYNGTIDKNVESIPNTEYNGSIVDGLSSDQNDWNENNFSQFSGPSSGLGITPPQSDTDASGNRHLNFCTASGCGFVLPGGGNSANTTDGDDTGDWNTSTFVRNGDWSNHGNDIYSPLYNAVIFVVGRVPQVSGNGGSFSLRYYDTATSSQATIALDGGSFNLNNTWRATIIATGSVGIDGTININPPTPTTSTYRWAVVTGRDLEMGGNANGFSCDDDNCLADLDETNSTFAGAFLAHEQIRFHGTPGIDGYVIAEDRAECSSDVSSTESDLNGGPQIHYDCENPSDPWAILSVRVQNWEENQRVQ